MHNPEFWLKKNDRVFLIKESELVGTVTRIDENLIETHGVTTCNVLWDGDTDADIQWTNKLALVERAA